MQGPPNLWPERPETPKKVNQVLSVVVQTAKLCWAPPPPPPPPPPSMLAYLCKKTLRYNSSIYLYFICKERWTSKNIFFLIYKHCIVLKIIKIFILYSIHLNCKNILFYSKNDIFLYFSYSTPLLVSMLEMTFLLHALWLLALYISRKITSYDQ